MTASIRPHKEILLIFSFVLLVACARPTAPSTSVPISATIDAEGVVKGYGISPFGFPTDYSRFSDFLKEVGGLPNGGVMFNGAWRQDVINGADAGEVPATAITVIEQATVYGYTPIIVFGWRSENSLYLNVPANATNDWTNEEVKGLFAQMLVDFASNYHPPYLFLGNENDAYFITHPKDYGRWVDFYNQAYDAIKAVSPETQVGPVFQYERLSGQGKFNQWTTPQWGALEAHDLSKIDVLGITLYPWLGSATPEEVPDNYLDPLIERIGDKPVAITETGWPAENLGVPTAWESSQEAQLRYIDALQRILPSVNLKMLNWLHLNPMVQTDANQVSWQIFSSISLRDSQGNKRPVYNAWAQYQP